MSRKIERTFFSGLYTQSSGAYVVLVHVEPQHFWESSSTVPSSQFLLYSRGELVPLHLTWPGGCYRQCPHKQNKSSSTFSLSPPRPPAPSLNRIALHSARARERERGRKRESFTFSVSASAFALRRRCTACDCFFSSSFSFRSAFAAFFDSSTAAARAWSSACLAAAVFGVGGAVTGTVVAFEAFAVRDERTARGAEQPFFALGVAGAAGVGAMLSVS